MIDYESAWTELLAWVAEEPNRGRAATLEKAAELCARHRVTEDELERAVRLLGPRVQDVLFNRTGARLTDALLANHEESIQGVGEGSAERRPELVHRSLAAT